MQIPDIYSLSSPSIKSTFPRCHILPPITQSQRYFHSLSETTLLSSPIHSNSTSQGINVGSEPFHSPSTYSRLSMPVNDNQSIPLDVQYIEDASTRFIKLKPNERTLFELLLRVIEHFDLKTTLRVAGGWVRDKILTLQSQDIDIALDNCSGVEFASYVHKYLQIHRHLAPGIEDVERMKIGSVGIPKFNPSQSKHLETAIMSILGIELNFVQLRSDQYSDTTRIPAIRTSNNPKEDAFRRDLTINSLFYNINTSMVEDWTGQGLRDLHGGILDTPLEPLETLKDDPLRALRIIRFATCYGYQINPTLLDTISNPLVHQILGKKVTWPRIGAELLKMVSWRKLALSCLGDGKMKLKTVKISNDPTISFNLLVKTNLHHILFKLDENKWFTDLKRNKQDCAGYPVVNCQALDENRCDTGHQQYHLHQHDSLSALKRITLLIQFFNIEEYEEGLFGGINKQLDIAEDKKTAVVITLFLTPIFYYENLSSSSSLHCHCAYCLEAMRQVRFPFHFGPDFKQKLLPFFIKRLQFSLSMSHAAYEAMDNLRVISGLIYQLDSPHNDFTFQKCLYKDESSLLDYYKELEKTLGKFVTKMSMKILQDDSIHLQVALWMYKSPTYWKLLVLVSRIMRQDVLEADVNPFTSPCCSLSTNSALDPTHSSNINLKQIQIHAFFLREEALIKVVEKLGLERARGIPHLLTGDEIMHLFALSPGPIVGRLIDTLLTWQITHLDSTKQEGIQFLRQQYEIEFQSNIPKS